jgi:ubiquinone biosynthesis protein COQ9
MFRLRKITTGVSSASYKSGKILLRHLRQSSGEYVTRPLSTDNGTSGSESDSDEVLVKERILEAALECVPQHGWSRSAITAGVEKLGLSPGAVGLFSSGGFDLADYFYKRCNKELAGHLQGQVTITDGKVQRSQPLPVFMESALRVRLSMIIPHLDTWHQAMALMSLPYNAPTSIRNLQTLVDDMWYYSGDTSTDLNWYTKRVTLAGVYKLTELCLVQDHSPDQSQTWAFLSRRMSDLASFGRGVRQIQGAGSFGRELASAVCTTSRNILGVGGVDR